MGRFTPATPARFPAGNQCCVLACAQVDPCDSREDPIVCAALVKANVYVDLEEVLEAEREFWKVMR